jgi:predicted GNAT family acetyltransferase
VLITVIAHQHRIRGGRPASAGSFCDDGPVIDSSEVRNDAGRSRFVSGSAGHEAELLYRVRNGRLILVHTEVPIELEGHGIGGKLVTAAVDYAAEHGLVVVPSCPFAVTWLDRHPDVAGRVQLDQPR